MKYNLQLVTILVGILFVSCEKEKKYESTPVEPGLKGVFCLNEGAFQAGNADVSFYPKSGGPAVRNLYFQTNTLPLGDVLQSMTIHNGKAYLCVNNSKKIEIVDTETFKRIGTIQGIIGPRYLLALDSSRAVVSDWNSNQLYKVDLTSLAIIDSVPCGNGPEQMLLSNGKVFVCNSGGFLNDSTITVIDAITFQVVGTIPTGVNPSFIKSDTNGKILVLCRGSLGNDYTPTSDDPGGRLLRIDPLSMQTESAYYFTYREHPAHLQLTEERIFFLNGSNTYTGKIQSMDLTDWTGSPTVLTQRRFYSIGIDPQSGLIYAGKASFNANTYVLRYSQSGTLIDSIPAGVAPSGFVFNP